MGYIGRVETISSSPLKRFCFEKNARMFIKTLQLINLGLLVVARIHISSYSTLSTSTHYSFLMPYYESTIPSSRKKQAHDNVTPYKNWCPHAKCDTRLHYKPCSRRYLFLLSQGRSG